MIVFGRTTLDDSVKDWTFEQLEEVFKGKIDYISLAKQLGIKPAKKPTAKAKKKESNQD